LRCNHKIPERHSDPEALDWTHRLYGSDTDDQLGNGNDDGRLDELSILPAIVAIEGHAVVRLLWSIMAGRLLHVLASAPGTQQTITAPQQIPSGI
jgi:hypothetical protein